MTYSEAATGTQQYRLETLYICVLTTLVHQIWSCLMQSVHMAESVGGQSKEICCDGANRGRATLNNEISIMTDFSQ